MLQLVGSNVVAKTHSARMPSSPLLVLKVGPSTSCSWRLLHAPPQKQVRRPTYKWAGGGRMSNRCNFGSASVHTTAARAIQYSQRSACVRYASVCIFVGCVSRVRGSSRLCSAHHLVATGVRHDGAAQPTSVRNCPAGVFDYGIGESMSARAFCLSPPGSPHILGPSFVPVLFASARQPSTRRPPSTYLGT